MAENEQEATAEVVAPEPYESESARYLRIRSEAKEQAAVTIAAEAKAAEKAKRKRLAGQNAVDPELADFNKRGLEIEKSINAKPATDVKEG